MLMWYYESLKVMNDEVLKSRFDSLKVGNKFRKNENFLLALSFWHGRKQRHFVLKCKGILISITKRHHAESANVSATSTDFRVSIWNPHFKAIQMRIRRSSPRTWKQTNNVSWEQRLSLKRQMGVVFNDPQTFCAEECKILPSDNLLGPPPKIKKSCECRKVEGTRSTQSVTFLYVDNEHIEVNFKTQHHLKLLQKKWHI